MKSPKIAPDLVARVRAEVVTYPSSAVWPRAERQLRALLEVARAVEHVVCEDRNRAPGTLHCSWQEAIYKTQRALARLRRVSGGGK